MRLLIAFFLDWFVVVVIRRGDSCTFLQSQSVVFDYAIIDTTLKGDASWLIHTLYPILRFLYRSSVWVKDAYRSASVRLS